MELIFKDQEHERYFQNAVVDYPLTEPSEYVIFYLFGLVPELQLNGYPMFSQKDGGLIKDCWDEPWQTEDTRRIIALILHLTQGEIESPYLPYLLPDLLFDTYLAPYLTCAIQYMKREGPGYIGLAS